MSPREHIRKDLELLWMNFGLDVFTVEKALKLGLTINDIQHIKMFGCIVHPNKDSRRLKIIKFIKKT